MSDMRTRDAPLRDADLRVSERSAFNFESHGTDESIGDLLRRLVDQGTHLADRQVELVKAEIHQSVTDLKEAAGEMAGAAVLGLAAVGVTLMGVAFLVAEIMPLWAATLIVGLVALAGAYALYSAASSKLGSKSMSVERSRRTLARAPEATTGHTEERHHHG